MLRSLNKRAKQTQPLHETIGCVGQPIPSCFISVVSFHSKEVAMQKKHLVQWLVGITGACLCLFVFSPTAFAQSAAPVGKSAGKVVVTDTIITDTLNDEP